MATFISTEKFERWWRKAQAWFATQFASINIDTSDLAKQGDNPAATNSAILEALSHINPQDPNSKALAEFFGLPEALPGSYVPATEAEIFLELESIWEDVTGSLSPLSSFSTNTAQRVVTNGVVSYRSIVAEEIG